MSCREGTGAKQQIAKNEVATLPDEFAKRLHERSAGTPSYSDFVDVVGEFVTVRDGKVDEDDPRTQMARQVLSILREARENSAV